MRLKSIFGLPSVFSLLALALLPSVVAAQGTGVQFLNFEAPAHEPIQVVTVAGVNYLLVANGPDNSVEVYDTTAQNNFLLRVPVGQRPVSILARPDGEASDAGRSIYVANWLGDSITIFDLEPTGDPVNPLLARQVATKPVGDEPVGMAFLPENPNDPNTLPGGVLHELLIVTFSSQASWGVFSPNDLMPIAGMLELFVNGTIGSPSDTFAVKDPRAIAFAPPPPGPGTYRDQMWILNFRGGNTATFDLDLWGSDDFLNAVGSETANLPGHGAFGTTNYQMEFAANGDLWVVGIQARNRDEPRFIESVGEPIMKGLVQNETGFAISYLARHTDLTNAQAMPDVLDLNDSTPGGARTQATPAVANPTDVAVYGSGDPNTGSQPNRTIVFATGNSSDTLAAVRPTAGGVAGWQVDRIDLNPGLSGFSRINQGGVMHGPRALALLASGSPNDPADRLYVYNRLSNSVSVVDPNYTSPSTALLNNFALQGQVEPAHIVAGRKFMYSSKLSRSSNVLDGSDGNVSCTTCHIDGNTDFLAWNLSDGGRIPAPGEPLALPGAIGPNPDRKGPMVTQPLLGLTNFEVIEESTRDLVDNSPFHWRGDKGTLDQFNAAFVNLMGAPNVATNPPGPAFNKGLNDTNMKLYSNFVFSMHYPPNPEQPWQRVYSGRMLSDPPPPPNTLQELIEFNDVNVGFGAQLGLKGFHVHPAACVHCHALPEGSNNRHTELLGHSQTQPPMALEAQNMETAQLKALVRKEKRLVRVNAGAFQFKPSPANHAITHEFGLIHTGESTVGAFGSKSINDFVAGFAGLPNPNTALPDAVSLYVREFDSGTAPLVGFEISVNVNEYTAAPASFQAGLQELEAQRLLAHVGIAVHARIDNVTRGFWYDVTDTTGKPYREEPQGIPTIGPFSSQEMLDFLDRNKGARENNLLRWHYTPLGSSRRVARVQGGLAAPLATAAPTNVNLLPAPAMIANKDVPRMIVNWQDLINNQLLFTFLGQPTDASQAAAVALFQLSLTNHAPSGFGVDTLRHEVPRRFRVSGDGIGDGAFLLLFPPTAADIASAPAPGQPPTTTPTLTSHPLRFLLPIYPARDDQNSLIWETAVELEPLFMMSLLNGAPASLAAVTALVDPGNGIFFDSSGNYTLSTQDLMQPTVNNFHFVQVLNVTATGTVASTGSWQSLTVQ